MTYLYPNPRAASCSRRGRLEDAQASTVSISNATLATLEPTHEEYPRAVYSREQIAHLCLLRAVNGYKLDGDSCQAPQIGKDKPLSYEMRGE